MKDQLNQREQTENFAIDTIRDTSIIATAAMGLANLPEAGLSIVIPTVTGIAAIAIVSEFIKGIV